MFPQKGSGGEKQITYELKYHNPWFWPDRTSLTAAIWNTDGIIDDGLGSTLANYGTTDTDNLNAHKVGGELTIGKPFSKEIRGFTTVHINNVSPSDTSIDSYRVRSIGLGMSYDTRDYVFNPSNGDFIYVKGTTSLKMLGASVEFLKTRVRYNKYFPLAEDWALGFKSTIDAAFGTVFDTERYFAGGATTVRGYKDGYPFAIGGMRALGSVELRYNINTSVMLYLFYDGGIVRGGGSYNNATFYGDDRLRTGKGIGFKIITPIGPLRFDYAWGDGNRYNENLDSSQGVIHFNIENAF